MTNWGKVLERIMLIKELKANPTLRGRIVRLYSLAQRMRGLLVEPERRRGIFLKLLDIAKREKSKTGGGNII